MLAGLLTEAVADEDGATRYIDSGRGRVPLGALLLFLEVEKPLEGGLRDILGRNIIAQHFATAVARNVDETQRLRLSLEEEGLDFIARRTNADSSHSEVFTFSSLSLLRSWLRSPNI